MLPPPDPPAAPRFRLMRYFTLATLGAFLAVGVTLFVLQRGEEEYFEQAQGGQLGMFSRAQAELAAQNEQAARASLLAVNEAAHVTLTGVVANLLWTSDIAPFVARAQAVSTATCAELPKGDDGAQADQARARRECFAALGARIRALPGFAALDAKAYGAMRGTSVFKIKVWDLRGLAVYSSEHRQIGDDGSGNKGFRAALSGQPASELTHRDRFSAFEGMVENRDLISTYVPVRDDPAGPVVGVFELYSDVTPFLAQARSASRRFAEIARANEDEVTRASAGQRDEVHESSRHFLLVVGGLLALLYAASLVIVRIGQRIIDRQALAAEQAAQREQLWHHEKMAALSAMADNVAHEVGNPLAVIAGVAEQLPPVPAPPAPDGGPAPQPARLILEQTDRIARMMRRISSFASARGAAEEWVDVNAMLRTMCDVQSFDRRFPGVAIDFQPGEHLPARELVPDRLNELMMALLQALAGRSAAHKPPAPIEVRTLARGDDTVIHLGWARPDGAPAGAMRQLAADLPLQQHVKALGGRMELQGEHALEVVLPPPWARV
jgi:signal transduction histidine kinase